MENKVSQEPGSTNILNKRYEVSCNTFDKPILNDNSSQQISNENENDLKKKSHSIECLPSDSKIDCNTSLMLNSNDKQENDSFETTDSKSSTDEFQKSKIYQEVDESKNESEDDSNFEDTIIIDCPESELIYHVERLIETEIFDENSNQENKSETKNIKLNGAAKRRLKWLLSKGYSYEEAKNLAILPFQDIKQQMKCLKRNNTESMETTEEPSEISNENIKKENDKPKNLKQKQEIEQSLLKKKIIRSMGFKGEEIHRFKWLIKRNFTEKEAMDLVKLPFSKLKTIVRSDPLKKQLIGSKKKLKNTNSVNPMEYLTKRCDELFANITKSRKMQTKKLSGAGKRRVRIIVDAGIDHVEAKLIEMNDSNTLSAVIRKYNKLLRATNGLKKPVRLRQTKSKKGKMQNELISNFDWKTGAFTNDKDNLQLKKIEIKKFKFDDDVKPNLKPIRETSKKSLFNSQFQNGQIVHEHFKNNKNDESFRNKFNTNSLDVDYKYSNRSNDSFETFQNNEQKYSKFAYSTPLVTNNLDFRNNYCESYQFNDQIDNFERTNILDEKLIKIGVISIGYPKIILTPSQLNVIQTCLLDKVLEYCHTKIKPKLLGCEIKKGWLMIICEDRITAEWLKNVVQQLNHVNHIEIEAIEERHFPDKITCIGVFPDSADHDLEVVLKFIRGQNENLNIDDWDIVWQENQNNDKKIIFCLNPESVLMLTKKNFKINFKFGNVTLVKIQKNDVHSFLKKSLLSKNLEPTNSTNQFLNKNNLDSKLNYFENVNQKENYQNDESNNDIRNPDNYQVWGFNPKNMHGRNNLEQNETLYQNFDEFNSNKILPNEGRSNKSKNETNLLTNYEDQRINDSCRSESREKYRDINKDKNQRISEDRYRDTSKRHQDKILDIIDLTKDQFQETSRDQFRSTSRDPFQETSRDQFRSTSRDPFQETSKDPFRETSKDRFLKTNRDQFTETSKDQFQETSRDQFRSTSRDPFQENSRDQFRSTSRDPFQETSKDPFRETSKDRFLKTNRDQFTETSKDRFQETSKDWFRSTSRDPFRETSKDRFQKTCRDRFRENSKDPFQKINTDQFQETIRDQFQNISRDPFRATSKDPFRETSKDRFLKTNRDQFVETSRDRFQETSRDRFRETSRDPFQKINIDQFQESSRDQFRNTSRDPFQATSKDPFRETSKDRLQETSRDRFQETSKDQFQETKSRNPFTSTSRDPFQETIKNPFRETSRGRFREASRDQFEETNRDQFRDSKKDQFRSTIRDRFNATTRDKFVETRDRFSDRSKDRFQDTSENRFRDTNIDRFQYTDRNKFQDTDIDRFQCIDRNRFRDTDRFQSRDKNRFRDTDRSRFRNTSRDRY